MDLQGERLSGTFTTFNNLVIKSGGKTIDTTDQNELAIVVRHKNVCDKHNHPPVKTDEIKKLHYVMNLKNRVANETESIQAIFQEEQNKFIEAKAGSLDLNQVSKLFPKFTEIQSSLYKQRYKNKIIKIEKNQNFFNLLNYEF